MSDNYLRFIPAEPGYVPSPVQIREALRALASSYCATAPKVTLEEGIRFVDPGSNLEKVSCPRCHVGLEFAWWGDAMDRAFQSGFQALDVTLPCCGKHASLSELDYDWPAGFARFVIEYPNPEYDIREGMLQAIGAVLGVRLRKIWAHV